MPSLQELGLFALFTSIALASPSYMERRQFGAPPPGCDDTTAFSQCVAEGGGSCFLPSPASQLAWYAFFLFNY